MVHFNQRMLLTGALGQEALWLSEGLAQIAEDLVGEAFYAAGNSSRAVEYQVGNWNRGRRFLQNPSNVSLISTLPPGSLAERGAWWIFLRYLYGQDGNEALLGRLTRSSLTGIANVTQATGRTWEDLVSDWAGALFLDGLSVPIRPGLSVPGLNLRRVLSPSGGGYPLKPPKLTGTFSIEGSLWSSSPDYYIITPPGSGGLALNLAGPEGRPQNPAVGLHFMVVRIK